MSQLILVNENDEITGYESKEKCHDGKGLLHRAFSIFLFDSKGRLLIQRRSAMKRLWPLFWSNTCCSHPRKGEEYLQAGERRLPEETGITSPITMVYKFLYSAQFQTEGSERELCAVMLARSDEAPRPDPEEIDEWRYIELARLMQEMKESPETFTPWFHLEVKELFGPRLSEICEILKLNLKIA